MKAANAGREISQRAVFQTLTSESHPLPFASRELDTVIADILSAR